MQPPLMDVRIHSLIFITVTNNESLFIQMLEAVFPAVSISTETVNNSDGSKKLKLVNSILQIKYALNNGLMKLFCTYWSTKE